MSLRYMPGLAFPSLDIFRRRNFRLRFWKEHMCYTNLSSSRVEFNTGDRITQMLFQKNEDTDFVKVSNCEDYVTERGIGGFGSTGS